MKVTYQGVSFDKKRDRFFKVGLSGYVAVCHINEGTL